MKYIVHYGAMQLLGVFSHADLLLRYGSRVIVKTPRGQEVGIVRCEATSDMTSKLDGGFIEDQILRLMTETDEVEYRKLQRIEQEKLECCRQIVQDMDISMEVVRVEHIFGGERIVIYYTAHKRIDFRELVKVLAAEFQTRVEMRQINVREGMKLLPSLGDCGREVCCGCFLHETPTITIKMAKLQRVSLDPVKISGHCGRLKCCLRYEYDCYIDKQKKKNREDDSDPSSHGQER
jgi:cell fate regulator YaaT (PSP1 superfamily)